MDNSININEKDNSKNANYSSQLKKVTFIIIVALLIWWLSKNIVWIVLISVLLWHLDINPLKNIRLTNITNKFVKQNSKDRENFTLFTAHPINFVCASEFDKMPLHMRLNSSGGVMYVSHNPPTREEGCKEVECLPNIPSTNWDHKNNVSYNQSNRRTNYLPTNYLHSKLIPRSGKCWTCSNKNIKNKIPDIHPH